MTHSNVIKQFPGRVQGSAPTDPAMVLARLSAALGLMQEQAVVMYELETLPKSMVSLRSRAADLGRQMREYASEQDAILAYSVLVGRKVAMLGQDEVEAIARHAQWLP